jgi:hypothetical protein
MIGSGGHRDRPSCGYGSGLAAGPADVRGMLTANGTLDLKMDVAEALSAELRRRHRWRALPAGVPGRIWLMAVTIILADPSIAWATGLDGLRS